jgi:hypothetical protein
MDEAKARQLFEDVRKLHSPDVPSASSAQAPVENRGASQRVGADASGSRRFPMLEGMSVDWQTAREIYRLYSCLYGTDQSLERLAERGGFGWSEVSLFIKKHQLAKARGMCCCANGVVSHTGALPDVKISNQAPSPGVGL